VVRSALAGVLRGCLVLSGRVLGPALFAGLSAVAAYARAVRVSPWAQCLPDCLPSLTVAEAAAGGR